MTDQEENCYIVHFPGSRATKMCNVGKQVLVAFPINGGQVQAVVKVDVMFNGQNLEGKWNCEKTVAPVNQLFRDSYRPDVSKAMGWPEDKIVPLGFCAPYECSAAT